MIAVSFVEEANAYEALACLKELEAKGAIALRDAAVVVRQEDGKIEQKDQFSHNSTTTTTNRGLLALPVGVLGGPLGLLLASEPHTAELVCKRRGDLGGGRSSV